MRADRTLSAAPQCLPKHRGSRGSSCRVILPLVVTNKPSKRYNGHVLLIQFAFCIRWAAWTLTRWFSFPMPKLHRRWYDGMQQNWSTMCRDCEGARLRLLSGVCPAGGRALWGLSAKVLHRSEVLPKYGCWLPFTAAHSGFGTMWTKNRSRCLGTFEPIGVW